HAPLTRIFQYKNQSLAKSVFSSAKLRVPMNMIGGSQTYPQQRSITHLWWKGILRSRRCNTMLRRCAAQVCDVSIIKKPSIAYIYRRIHSTHQ
ncbi:hypothetical protein SFRURICE_004252, partial [Spodoptera frugiperda]